MTAENIETSDYHVNDWYPEIKIFPDMIPMVGFVISYERVRKQRGLSFKEDLKCLIKDISNPRLILSIGTANWPKPTDLGAYARSQLMGARNMAFAEYHTMSPFWGALLINSIPSLVNTVSEQLSKLPLG